jgi:hypothetical protein
VLPPIASNTIWQLLRIDHGAEYPSPLCSLLLLAYIMKKKRKTKIKHIRLLPRKTFKPSNLCTKQSNNKWMWYTTYSWIFKGTIDTRFEFSRSIELPFDFFLFNSSVTIQLEIRWLCVLYVALICLTNRFQWGCVYKGKCTLVRAQGRYSGIHIHTVHTHTHIPVGKNRSQRKLNLK